MILGNSAVSGGSAVMAWGDTSTLNHNTLASNLGTAVFVTYSNFPEEIYSDLVFSNTILVSSTLGIQVSAGKH